jgi:hypothetical protein
MKAMGREAQAMIPGYLILRVTSIVQRSTNVVVQCSVQMCSVRSIKRPYAYHITYNAWIKALTRA